MLKWVKNIMGLEPSSLMSLYRHRSRQRGIPTLSDPEFYHFINPEIYHLLSIKKTATAKKWDEAHHGILEYFRNRELPLFYFHYSQKETLLKYLASYPYYIKYIDSLARKACAHRLMLPYIGEVHCGAYIDWFSDFQGGSHLYGHYKELASISETLDLHSLIPTWELNKHLFLIDLGKAYWLTAEEKYAEEIMAQLDDWIERNPVNMGVNWLNPEVAAQRLISWIFLFNLLLPSSLFTGNFAVKCLKVMLLSACFLLESLNRTPLPQDRFVPGAALYLFGFLFPEFECAKLFKSTGARLLEQTLNARIASDGSSPSGNLASHCQTLELALMAQALAKLHGESFPPAWIKQIAKALEFESYQFNPLNELPFPDQVLHAHCWGSSFDRDGNLRSLLAAAAGILDKPELKNYVKDYEPEALWLIGIKTWKTYAAMVPAQPDRLQAYYPQGSYLISREHWEESSAWCWFRGLPQEGETLEGNLLDFMLMAKGEALITASGTYPGNTLTVPELNLEAKTILKASRRKETAVKPVSYFKEKLAYLKSAYTTLTAAGESLTLERELIFDPATEWCVLCDTLLGKGSVNAELYLHLAPQDEIIIRGDLGCLIRGKRLQARLCAYFPSSYDCLVAGNESITLKSKNGFLMKPRPVKYFGTVSLPAKIYTWISWSLRDYKSPQIKTVLDFVAAATPEPVRH